MLPPGWQVCWDPDSVRTYTAPGQTTLMYAATAGQEKYTRKYTGIFVHRPTGEAYTGKYVCLNRGPEGNVGIRCKKIGL